MPNRENVCFLCSPGTDEISIFEWRLDKQKQPVLFVYYSDCNSCTMNMNYSALFISNRNSTFDVNHGNERKPALLLKYWKRVYAVIDFLDVMKSPKRRFK
jgi:hypothetical protein